MNGTSLTPECEARQVTFYYEKDQKRHQQATSPRTCVLQQKLCGRLAQHSRQVRAAQDNVGRCTLYATTAKLQARLDESKRDKARHPPTAMCQ
jgi:hypothetical protein